MSYLTNLQNSHRPRKKVQRVGRGVSSGRGKTATRGQKGGSSRSGWEARYGYEGGQMRLYTKLPTRGFTRGRFKKPHLAINLGQLDKYFQEGEIVSLKTLREKKLIPSYLTGGIKILSKGNLTKKLTIEAKAFSKEAIKKIEAGKSSYKVLG